MPLTLAAAGEENIIRKVGGNPEVKKHLEDLGFVAGDTVTVVSSLAGNVIVKVMTPSARQSPSKRSPRRTPGAKRSSSQTSRWTSKPSRPRSTRPAMRSRAPRASPMKKSDSPFSGNERSPSIPEAPSCPHAGRAGFSMCGTDRRKPPWQLTAAMAVLHSGKLRRSRRSARRVRRAGH